MNTATQSILIKILFMLALPAFSACGSNSSNNDIQRSSRGDLVSSDFLATYNHSDIETVLAGTGLFDNFPAIYNVSAYKIVYKTEDPRGSLINASGLLAVPVKATGAKSPLLSLQHGTVFTDAEVPSNTFGPTSAEVIMATFGYIASAPDYIGYAASTQEIHPYIQAKPSGKAVVDMIRAARKFFAGHNIAANSQLFLAGYSEGGYVTIAAQQMMRQNFAAEFPVTASSAGAGPYDISGTVASVLQQPLLAEPSVVGFVMKAYDTVYGLNRIADIFQAPYTVVVDTYYDGTKSGSEINSQLTNITTNLFYPQFLADYMSSGETRLKALFAENDVYNWTPAAPTRFYHGRNDTIVPFQNAQTAVNTMKANGAPDVELVECSVGVADHYACALPYIAYTVGFFSNFANDL